MTRFKLHNPIIIALVFLAVYSDAIAQQGIRVKRAEAAYNAYAYPLAIQRFEGISKKNTDHLRMLAMSYAKTGNSVEAERVFFELIEAGSSNPEDYFHFAEALLSNKKYDAYQTQMAKYDALVKNDNRAKEALSKPEIQATLWKDQKSYVIQNLEMNSSEDDFAPFFYGDAIGFATSNTGAQAFRKLYSWNERAFLDLYYAEQNASGQLVKSKPIDLDINSKLHEASAALSPDGSLFYFTRNNSAEDKPVFGNTGVNNLHLFYCKKLGDSWSEALAIGFNSNTYSVGHPAFSSDGITLYFSSDMPGGIGGVDLWKATINTDGTLSNPENLGATINTLGNEMFPFVDADNNLYFVSDGHVGLGMLDMFKSSNTTGEPQNLAWPMNSPKDDFGLIVDVAKKQGFFSSNRDGGKGNDDIYGFEIIKKTYLLNGLAVDAKSGYPVPNVDLLMISSSMDTTAFTTDSLGEWTMEVDLDKTYDVKPTDSAFSNFTDRVEINNPIRLAYNSILSLPISNEEGGSQANPSGAFTITGKVIDGMFQNPLDEVRIEFLDPITEALMFDFKTQKTGRFFDTLNNVPLGSSFDFLVRLSKPGFLTKSAPFDTLLGNNYGLINLDDFLLKHFQMLKAEAGTAMEKISSSDEVELSFPTSELPSGAFTITGKVLDGLFQNPLADVRLEFLDPKTKELVFDFKTGNQGRFFDTIPSVPLGNRFDYIVRLSKPGFLTKSAPFDTLLGNEYGLINLDDFLLKEFKMLKAEIGSDLGKLLNIKPIYFDLNKSTIRPDAAIELDLIVDVLTQNPNLYIELGSHTDCRGSEAYNLILSDDRAKASAKYISERIDNPKRISGKGYGESMFVNDCACEGDVKSDCSDEEHQENRRTEFKVIK